AHLFQSLGHGGRERGEELLLFLDEVESSPAGRARSQPRHLGEELNQAFDFRAGDSAGHKWTFNRELTDWIAPQARYTALRARDRHHILSYRKPRFFRTALSEPPHWRSEGRWVLSFDFNESCPAVSTALQGDQRWLYGRRAPPRGVLPRHRSDEEV